MSDERNDGANMLFAFLAGAIIGVGVGILIAPKSGKETRKQVSDLAQKAQEKAADLTGRFRQRAEGAVEEIKGTIGA